LWDQHWSYARMILHLSDDEFFALTPRQFHILLDRHKENIQHQELQTGILAAVFANYTVNWSMNRPKKSVSFKPSDFMPCEMKKTPKKRQTKKAKQKQAEAQMQGLAGFLTQRHLIANPSAQTLRANTKSG